MLSDLQFPLSGAHFEEINDEHRIRIRISKAAASVLDEDKYTYAIEKTSTILNTVFRSMWTFYLESDERTDAAFPFARLQHEQERLRNWIQDSDTLHRALQDEKARLDKAYQELLPDGPADSVLIVINADNYSFLTKECKEAPFYGPFGMSSFFRAVIESYAQKTHLEREKIMTVQTVRTIRNAIQSRTHLKITTHAQEGHTPETFLVKPYQIMQNPLSTFSYLVGLSRKAGEEGDAYRLASFRISRIRIIRGTQNQFSITAKERQHIEREIRSRGVPYLLDTPEPIKVSLLPEGMQMYTMILTSRPPYQSKTQRPDGSWELEFFCTEKQAENYFFPFGSFAQILSPLPLREKICQKYKKAVSAYTVQNEKEKDA